MNPRLDLVAIVLATMLPVFADATETQKPRANSDTQLCLEKLPRSAYERSLKTPSLPNRPNPTVIEQFDGMVIRVIDGDTIIVDHNGTHETIRIQGIDAPELDQGFGKEATQFVRTEVLKWSVKVQGFERDQDGRLVADVYRSDGKSLGVLVVSAGFAWRYDEYAYDPLLLIEHNEDIARCFRSGLWQDSDAIAPWEFRAGKRSGRFN